MVHPGPGDKANEVLRAWSQRLVTDEEQASGRDGEQPAFSGDGEELASEREGEQSASGEKGKQPATDRQDNEDSTPRICYHCLVTATIDAQDLTVAAVTTQHCFTQFEQMLVKPRVGPDHMSRQHCPNKQELANEDARKRYRYLSGNLSRDFAKKGLR